MTSLYIRKIESALQRALTASERKLAETFMTAGYHVSYAIEYFK